MRIGVIGCGKMAGAIVGRWVTSGIVDAETVRALEVDEERAAAVGERLGIACGTDARSVLQNSDLVLLGIKPQAAEHVLPSLAALARPEQVWLSILAGLPAARVKALLGGGPTVVRLMPNTPARLGLGCTAVAWPAGIDRDKQAFVLRLLQGLGVVVPLAEDAVDRFTAIAGSGPAYVFLFLQGLQAAAEQQGFDPEQARELALVTVRGAAALAADTQRSFAELRADVTSPGGTTQAAIEALLAAGVNDAMAEAVKAAVRRASELAGS